MKLLSACLHISQLISCGQGQSTLSTPKTIYPIATNAYKVCRTIFRFYSKAMSTTYYAYISYVHWYAYCYQLCMTHVNNLTQHFHILFLVTPNS